MGTANKSAYGDISQNYRIAEVERDLKRSLKRGQIKAVTVHKSNTNTHRMSQALLKNFRKKKIKASEISGDPEADNVALQHRSFRHLLPYCLQVTDWCNWMTSCSGGRHCFTYPVAPICSEIADSLGDRHRLLLSPEHQSVLQRVSVNCSNN